MVENDQREVRFAGEAPGADKIELKVIKGNGTLSKTTAVPDSEFGAFMFTAKVEGENYGGNYVVHVIPWEKKVHGEPVVVKFSLSAPRDALTLQGTNSKDSISCRVHAEGPRGAELSARSAIGLGADGSGTFSFFVPRAKKMVFAGKTYPLQPQSRARATVPLLDRISTTNAKALLTEAIRVPIEITTFQGTYKGNVECTRLFSFVAQRISSGGWPLTTPRPPKGNATMLVRATPDTTALSMTVLGAKDRPAKDVDYVADLSTFNTDHSPCNYRNPKTGETKPVVRWSVNLRAKVYDRRAGKFVATKTWKAKKPGCEAKVKSSEVGFVERFSGGQLDAAWKWLGSRL